MGSLQAPLADFGQENHLGHHLHNFPVGLGSQVGALDRDPVALGSQTGAWGKQQVLGKQLVDTEGHTQLANTDLGGEHRFACCGFP